MPTSDALIDQVKGQFGEAILASSEPFGFPTLCVAKDRIREVLRYLRDEPDFAFDVLTDATAADGLKYPEPWETRFQVVYHLRSSRHGHRLRVKVGVPERDCVVESVHDLWKSANWAEREIFDMFGVRFDGHPNLKRILCHHKFKGHALRKDYFIHDGQWLDEPETLLDEIGDWGENPADEGFSELVPVNLGPAHPAMHGTLRVFAKMEGETIVKAVPEIGYLHRGFEKHSETGNWTMVIPYTDRLNYCSAMLNNIGYVRTVEKMFGIEPTERCKYIRVIVGELSRIIDHCVCLGAMLVDLGALTNFWYLFNIRERVYHLLEGLCGARLTSSYARIGGMAHDLQDGFETELREILRDMPRNVSDVLGLIAKNRIFLDRTVGIGVISREDALSWGWTGPCLRATGIPYDIRKSEPYDVYADLDWDVATREGGDVHDRAMVRFDEMIQSMRIIEQALDRMPEGPVMVDDKRVVLPEKDKVYSSIEGLMNHFVLIYDGIKVPAGEAYVATEGANGELGFYVISDGSGRPYRVHCRAPSFYLYCAYPSLAEGNMVADAVPLLGSLNIIAGELDR